MQLTWHSREGRKTRNDLIRKKAKPGDRRGKEARPRTKEGW